jgi:hypothetical protein
MLFLDHLPPTNRCLAITLEIQASLPGGVSEQIIRTVTENSRMLKFSTHGFESE